MRERVPSPTKIRYRGVQTRVTEAYFRSQLTLCQMSMCLAFRDCSVFHCWRLFWVSLLQGRSTRTTFKFGWAVMSPPAPEPCGLGGECDNALSMVRPRGADILLNSQDKHLAEDLPSLISLKVLASTRSTCLKEVALFLWDLLVDKLLQTQMWL